MRLGLNTIGKSVGIVLLCLLVFSASDTMAQGKPNLPVTQAANVQSLEEIRSLGFGFLKSGDWESAKRSFENALRIAPKDTLSIYGYSLALFNLKSYSEARKNLDAGMAILSKSSENKQFLVDFLVLSSLIYAIENKNSTAITELKKAVTIAPNHFDANLSLGRAYFGSGDIDKSVRSFRQAVLIQPANAKARFFLATALERSGETPEALAEYRKVLEINPNSADGNLGLGVLLVKTEGNRSVEGQRALRKAIEVNPDLYEAQIMLGKTLTSTNQANEALTHLKKAAELAPNNPEPHFQLSIAYRKLGKRAEAAAEAEKVKKIHENRRKVGSSNPK